MKKSILAIAIFSLGLALVNSCGETGVDDPKPAHSATTLDKLQGSWNLSSATLGGTDVSSEYTGFSITISNSNYTITNGGLAWATSTGTLGLSGSNTDSIDSMGGNINISIEFSNNDNTLKLTFTITETLFGSGRINGLPGNYIFTLTK